MSEPLRWRLPCVLRAARPGALIENVYIESISSMRVDGKMDRPDESEQS